MLDRLVVALDTIQPIDRFHRESVSPRVGFNDPAELIAPGAVVNGKPSCEVCGLLLDSKSQLAPVPQPSGTGCKCGNITGCMERKRKRDDDLRNAPTGAATYACKWPLRPSPSAWAGWPSAVKTEELVGVWARPLQ